MKSGSDLGVCRDGRLGVVLLHDPGESGGGVLGSVGGEVVEPGRFGDLERGEDLLLAGGDLGALREVSFVGGEGDQVEPVELVADVAPGGLRWCSR